MLINAREMLGKVRENYKLYVQDKLLYFKAYNFVSEGTINLFKAHYKEDLRSLWQYAKKTLSYCESARRLEEVDNIEIAVIIVSLFKVMVMINDSDNDERAMNVLRRQCAEYETKYFCLKVSKLFRDIEVNEKQD